MQSGQEIIKREIARLPVMSHRQSSFLTVLDELAQNYPCDGNLLDNQSKTAQIPGLREVK